MRKITSYIICWLLFFSNTSFSQTHIFAQLTGAPVNTSGWNFQGLARVSNILYNDKSEVLICDNLLNQSGAVFYKEAINLAVCNKWKAEFDMRIYDGTSADGLAFCFLDVPPVGFVLGGGMGVPAGSNGLKVCFDTYNNCLTDPRQLSPKVEIRWGPGYDECNATQPTANSIFEVRSSNYSHVMIEYDNGNIKVSINGNLILSGFQEFKFSGYLGFTASTGGSRDNHSIRNVVIYADMPPSNAGSSSAAMAVCPNTQIQLGVSSNPNYVYTWTPANGLTNANISNPVLQLSNNTGDISNNTYFVKTGFLVNPGCTSTDSIKIQIYPTPIIKYSTPPICLDDAIAIFSDSSSILDAGSLPLQYLWHFGDGYNSSATNPDSSILQNPTHKYAKAAVYPVSLKVTTAKGCVDSLSQSFTVNGSNPIPDFVVAKDYALCSNQPVFIKDQSTVDFGAITKVAIYWDAINLPADSILDNQSVAGKTFLHNYQRFMTPASIPYTIRYRVYSGISCVKELTKTVNIFAAPQIRFPTLNPVCVNNGPIQFNKAGVIGFTTGTPTYFGRGIVDVTGLFNPTLAGPGIDTIGYLFVTNNACADTAYQPITVWPAPTVNAGADFIVLEGGTKIMNASATGNQLTYQWLPAVYLDDASLLLATCTPKSDTQYVLKVTDINGCNNSDTVNVKVLFNPLVPNVFSPNGDNINDTWMIKYLESYPDCIVQVFSRSGQQVFFSAGYSVPWDGRYHGQPLPIATYYYIIKSELGKKLLSGSVTIIR